MKNNVIFTKIIGWGLVLLYVVLLIGVMAGSNEGISIVYPLLLAVLLVSSAGVVSLKEWGRKGVVLSSALMIAGAALTYFFHFNLVPGSQFFVPAVMLFYFNQPLIKEQFAKTKVSSWRSILVVDDDESHIKIVRPILISQGYSVLTAVTGEEGLQIAKNQKPDVILLDVILPGIKGRDLCRILKSDESTRNIPIIFLTAKDSPDDIRAEKDAGAVAHLTKPVNAKILVSTIRDVLVSKHR